MYRGSLIRDVRHEEGVSQAELARRLGTTQSAIAHLEAPGANPRVRTIERALHALGRELELRPRRPGAPVDVAQIDKHLAMTPAERLRAHGRAARSIRDLRDRARRVDAG